MGLRASYPIAILLLTAGCQDGCGARQAQVEDAGAAPVVTAPSSAASSGAANDTTADTAPDADVPDATTAAAPRPVLTASSGSGAAPVKTPCPDVPKPSAGRYSACEAQGGKLLGVETDGCVRGYECVKPK